MNPNELSIAGRAIGFAHPTFVIAEIGVNHDGSLARALELVDHAANAGADAVKLQIFQARRLMHGSGAFAEYQKERCADADPVSMLARYELAPRAVDQIVRAIRAKGLVPLATPFSPDDVEPIQRLDLPAIKIASPDLVNLPLLKRCAALGKPMILSTGAATMEEVNTTVEWLRTLDPSIPSPGTPGEGQAEGRPTTIKNLPLSFSLLHCISSYPVPNTDANLCWIPELANTFHVPVGYSDHTTDPLSGALAVAAGAVIIEKHLTYDRSAEGPDHSASADPTQFAQYVRSIRTADVLRGLPGKRVLPVEQDVRTVSRQSLVAARALREGQAIRESDLTVQRPGTAIPAADLPRVVGLRLTRDVPAGTLLTWPMLAA